MSERTVRLVRPQNRAVILRGNDGYAALGGRVGRLERSPNPGVARYRQIASRARLAGISTNTVWVGDSLTESFTPSKRNMRWTDMLSRMINGDTGKQLRYVPGSANVFSAVTPASSWPGSQDPWVSSGTHSGRIDIGLDLHGRTVPSGGYLELTYFGDVVTLLYAQTPTGATSTALLHDGASAGTIDTNNDPMVTSVPVTLGTIGDYGIHTIRITPGAGGCSIEGALVSDGPTYGFGIPFGGIGVIAGGHAGFDSVFFSATDTWAKSVALCAPSLVGIGLGTNDFAAVGLPPAEFRDNLVTMMAAVDAALLAIDEDILLPGYLLYMMPGLDSDALPQSYVEAAWAACTAHDRHRCGVIDFSDFYPPEPTNQWGPLDSGDGGHPGDAGQLWIASTLAGVMEPHLPAQPLMRRGGPIIEASDEPTTRSSWTASLGATAGQTYDDSGASAATVRERRHRTWLEAGTYVARIRYEQRTTNPGTFQVVVGTGSVGLSTATGTQATTGTDGTIAESQLSGTITVDSPGWYPVIIRKTSATGTVRFVRLHLRKTG